MPCFYERIGGDLPLRWIKRMKASIATGLGFFSSTRMVEDYDREFYRPAAAAYEALIADNAAAVVKLVEDKRHLVDHFDNGKIHVGSPKVEGDLSGPHVGDKFNVTVDVNLSDLPPEMVEVDAYYGTVNAHNEIVESRAEPLALLENRGNGNYLYGGEVTCRSAGRFGLTARVKAIGTDWDNSVPGFMTWPE